MTSLALALLLVGSTTAPAAPNMQEGEWESAIEMEIPGVPFAMPPMSFKNTQCLTQKDIVPNTARKDQKC